MKASKGFTLIELAVVLAVIAILAAIMTPIVTGYIDEARITRAAGDTRAIATAIIGYQRDTSFFPVYSSRTNANLDAVGDNQVLVGTGSTPTNGSGGAAWNLTSTATLETQLNTNVLSLPTSSVGGRIAFKGPYLQIAADPWGNAYLVNSAELTRTNVTNYGFVVSAGPNGTLETDPTQARTGTFAVGGDDIVQRIR